MILSDSDIQEAIEHKQIGYSPFDPLLLNPASIDMRLHDEILVPNPLVTEIDMREVKPGHTDPCYIDDLLGYQLDPGDFILACTQEEVTLPESLVARVEGKSSVGRVGLAVHITAGFIDPGFQGQITLEIANVSPWKITLHSGMRIAQIAFQVMNSPARSPYGVVGHYQGQRGPTESRYRIT